MAPLVDDLSILGPSAYDGVAVTMHEISFVKPESPTRSQLLYLSSLDLFWREFWFNRRLLFYKLSLQEQPLFLAKLKSSLSQVLVPFYPVAGRLAFGPDGRTAIDCSDQGVEFVDVSVEATLQELESSDFQPCPFLSTLARWAEHDVAKINEMPLLSIQVTKFACGGVAVGYTHSHVIADGHSMWHFMNSWAECARGEAIAMLPLHDRTALRVEKPSEEIAAQMNLPPEREDAGDVVGAMKPTEPLVERLFHVRPEMINKLKQEAAADSHQGGDEQHQNLRLTSYVVMCAHFWRSVMKAREVEEGEVVRLAVLADMRTRVKPPLPPEYFGNAIMFAFANSTAGELQQEGLRSLAAKIHGATEACHEASMWAKAHWLELHDNKFGNRLQWVGSCMNVSSSPKFNVYGVDFGWGKPLAVRPACVNGDGEMVLFPGRPSGIDVCMPLTRAAMHRLLQDPDFLSC